VQSSILSLLFVILLTNPALAFTTIHWPGTSPRTHVVVAGEGFDEMGSQFTKSALAMAAMIIDQDPQSNVVLYIAEGDGQNPTRTRLTEWLTAFSPRANVESNGTQLTGQQLLWQLRDLKAVAGLYVYSHSSPVLGLVLQKNKLRFSSELPNIESLKNNFTEDAVGMLFGCNTGLGTAPKLARLWNIPIMGSLTSTNFQQLHSNGSFYNNDPGLYPSNSWASVNLRSYKHDWKCPDGDCLRMKTDNIPYTGKWGKFSAGLGFYKWFCPANNEDRCLQGMRNGAMLWVGPSSGQFQLADFINDFFCPEDSSSERFHRCATDISEALRANNLSYSAFEGTSLNCSFSECAADLSFTNTVPRKLILTPRLDRSKDSTMMIEVHAYLKAFAQTGIFLL